MKIKIITLFFLIVASTASSLAYAAADDIEWIAKCMLDNKDEKKSNETVKTYCECMDEKMSASEDKSVTEWEKSHPKEEAECSAKAGWK